MNIKNLKYLSLISIFLTGAIFGVEQQELDDLKLCEELTNENYSELVAKSSQFSEDQKIRIREILHNVLIAKQFEEDPSYQFRLAFAAEELLPLKFSVDKFCKSDRFLKILTVIRANKAHHSGKLFLATMIGLYKTIFAMNYAGMAERFDLKVSCFVNNIEAINRLLDKSIQHSDKIAAEDLNVLVKLQQIYCSVTKNNIDQLSQNNKDLVSVKNYYDTVIVPKRNDYTIKIFKAFINLIALGISQTNMVFVKGLEGINLFDYAELEKLPSIHREKFIDLFNYIEKCHSFSRTFNNTLKNHAETLLIAYNSFYDYLFSKKINLAISIKDRDYSFPKDPSESLQIFKAFIKTNDDDLLRELGEDLVAEDTKKPSKKSKHKKSKINISSLSSNSSQDILKKSALIAGQRKDTLLDESAFDESSSSFQDDEMSPLGQQVNSLDDHKSLAIAYAQRVNDWFVNPARALKIQGYIAGQEAVNYKLVLAKKFGKEGIVSNHRFPVVIDHYIFSSQNAYVEQQGDGSFFRSVPGYYTDQQGLRKFGFFEIAYVVEQKQGLDKKSKKKSPNQSPETLMHCNIFHRFFRPVEKFSGLFAHKKDLLIDEKDLDVAEIQATIATLDSSGWTIEREREGWSAQEQSGFVMVSRLLKEDSYKLTLELDEDDDLVELLMPLSYGIITQ